MTREVVLLCGVITCALGFVSLMGYFTGNSAMYAPVAQAVGMAPNTALGFVSIGIALFLLARSL